MDYYCNNCNLIIDEEDVMEREHEEMGRVIHYTHCPVCGEPVTYHCMQRGKRYEPNV